MTINYRIGFKNIWIIGSFILIISYFFIYYLYYSKVLDYSYIEKLFSFAPKEHVAKITKEAKKNILAFPIVVIIFVVLRVAFLSFILLMGSFINEKKIASYKKIVTILVLSEFVFLFRDFLIIGASLLSRDPHRPSIDLSFSLDKLFSSAIVALPGINIILKSLSLYLVIYFIVVSFLFAIGLGDKFKESLRFTLVYVGTGYIIWIMLNAGANLYISY